MTTIWGAGDGKGGEDRYSEEMAGEPGELNLWDQQPGEPNTWYGRFQLYLSLGPTRSVLRACRVHNQSEKIKGGHWHAQAVEWHWMERAYAWDAWQRSLLALSERNLRRGLRQSRIGVTVEALDLIRAAMERAEIAEADRELAREWLPQLRVFLRDMLVVQRQEFEHDFSGDDPANEVAITADDLLAAQRALEARGGAAAGALERRAGLPIVPAGRKKVRAPCPFLVCPRVGSEQVLGLRVLRAVQAETGLRFQRLRQATRGKLSDTLRRQRGLGQPIEYMHVGLPVSAAGLELLDGRVDGAWLRGRLEGVRVLLLASCAAENLSDWQGAAPHVITLGDGMAGEDAAVLAEQFWRGIGLGQEVEEALEGALRQCPPGVRADVGWRR